MVFTVGIAGITARVALCVVQELLKRPDVRIRGYCRSPAKLPAHLLRDPHVSLTQGQFDDESALKSFVKGCDVMICTYLADIDVMIEGQKLLIDLCEEEGVGRYISSDYTEYLDTKNIKAVHILVGLFMETLFSELFYFWEPKEAKIQYYGSGNEVLELTTYHTTGQYVAAVALDTEAVGFFRFLGDRKTTHQIISDFTSVYGTEPAVERLGSLEDLYKQAHQNGEQDYVKVGAYFILKGAVYLKGDLDCARYPDIKPMTLEDFFKQHPVSQLSEALSNVGYS
ncbi:hypothetical protein BGZ61DRAFT_559078 [Ilyonectria robusta]|uniref:uncharacterized protein n=1 Tax=Ilyonectria robusta TaxID=1079257 RepID=UPI001E8D2137|nr:uncharacterized protein BGZ61DRAFT_559078 [Ilyonectria robusta]KAH8666200.1 hypothetical protein BGZ61DRAFT_559078 [Ilyonectria robusta]